jgi:hypothetical protein
MHVTAQEVLSDDRKSAVLLELERILGSVPFRGSRRCCRFLEYSVQHVLKGCTAEGLKERTIGIEALQRPADYDTSEDAIVRVTANEVRKRLAQYYQGEGLSADPVISLPSGAYSVTFHWLLPAVQPEEAEAVPRTAAKPRLRLAAGLVLLVLTGSAVVYEVLPARNPPAAVRTDPLWPRLFHSGRKTNIVLSDTVYREVQYFLGRDISLSEYLAPGYPVSLVSPDRPELKSVIAFLGRQQTTSIGSATMGSRLVAFGLRMGGDPVIRYARHINGREFRTDNFILLGSRLSVPWVQMFEPSLNFTLATDQATHQFYLRNGAPKPGEQAEYRESANQEETYADIALLPNLDGTGTVLILSGIDMVAAESAGEFAINGSLGAAVGDRYGEILIRVRALAGTASNIEVVAKREIAPGK